MQRKKRLKKFRDRIERRDNASTQRPLDELLYDANLPEVRHGIRQTLSLLIPGDPFTNID